MATVIKRDLSFFMREPKEQIIKVPAPKSFGNDGKDENGEPIMLEIRVLSREKIQEINEKYRDTKIATDPKGNPYVVNGEVVHEVVKDNVKAGLHIFVEALAYPNLKDEALMKHFGAVRHIEMPWKVFSDPREFTYVNDQILIALGMKDAPTNEEILQDAKN